MKHLGKLAFFYTSGDRIRLLILLSIISDQHASTKLVIPKLIRTISQLFRLPCCVLAAFYWTASCSNYDFWR